MAIKGQKLQKLPLETRLEAVIENIQNNHADDWWKFLFVMAHKLSRSIIPL